LLFHKISIVFSLDFIKNEIKEAENIKDKKNRKCVVKVLSFIHQKIKNINIPLNGIIIFGGINNENQEILEIIEPLNSIDEFYYTCSKYFETERFMKLFEEKQYGIVVFISGDECLIYKYNGIFSKIKSINACLIKRQRKGGQSSVRFSRLAEESRIHYITNVVDNLNEIVKIENGNNWVFGGNEMVKMLLENKELKNKFLTDNCYHTFNNDTINNSYFKELMKKSNINKYDEQKVDKIIELLERDPDYLLFSEEEIIENINNIENIILIDLKIGDYENLLNKVNYIIIDRKSKYYVNLKNYKIIAKIFYKNNNQY
jgi:hypothetical protein